mmetsp:Transcript_23238/g.44245  ORF Transcript_23238/g.44245 Transcript_23238/m.44245 type:complete len:282 (-) Transcript_23238:125-970(-)
MPNTTLYSHSLAVWICSSHTCQDWSTRNRMDTSRSLYPCTSALSKRFFTREISHPLSVPFISSTASLARSVSMRSMICSAVRAMSDPRTTSNTHDTGGCILGWSPCLAWYLLSFSTSRSLLLRGTVSTMAGLTPHRSPTLRSTSSKRGFTSPAILYSSPTLCTTSPRAPVCRISGRDSNLSTHSMELATFLCASGSHGVFCQISSHSLRHLVNISIFSTNAFIKTSLSDAFGTAGAEAAISLASPEALHVKPISASKFLKGCGQHPLDRLTAYARVAATPC